MNSNKNKALSSLIGSRNILSSAVELIFKKTKHSKCLVFFVFKLPFYKQQNPFNKDSVVCIFLSNVVKTIEKL